MHKETEEEVKRQQEEKEEKERKLTEAKRVVAQAIKSSQKASRNDAAKRMKEVKRIQDALDKERLLESVSTTEFICKHKKCSHKTVVFSLEASLNAHTHAHELQDALEERKKLLTNAMSQKQEQAPGPGKTKPKIVCTVKECKKKLNSKEGLQAHIRAVHN